MIHRTSRHVARQTKPRPNAPKEVSNSSLYFCEMFKLLQVENPPLHRGPQDLVPVLHVEHVQLLQHWPRPYLWRI